MAIALKTSDLYHVRRENGEVHRLVYKGVAGKGLHWFEDPTLPAGGQFFLSESEFVILGAQETLIDQTSLTAPGDAMQSAASRLAAGVRRVGADRALGYEDSMALREVDSAVDEWTEARR